MVDREMLHRYGKQEENETPLTDQQTHLTPYDSTAVNSISTQNCKLANTHGWHAFYSHAKNVRMSRGAYVQQEIHMGACLCIQIWFMRFYMTPYLTASLFATSII